MSITRKEIDEVSGSTLEAQDVAAWLFCVQPSPDFDNSLVSPVVLPNNSNVAAEGLVTDDIFLQAGPVSPLGDLEHQDQIFSFMSPMTMLPVNELQLLTSHMDVAPNTLTENSNIATPGTTPSVELFSVDVSPVEVREENEKKRKSSDDYSVPDKKKNKIEMQWFYKNGSPVPKDVIERGTRLEEGLHIIKNYIIVDGTKTQIFKSQQNPELHKKIQTIDIESDQGVSPIGNRASAQCETEQGWFYHDGRPVPPEVTSKSLIQTGVNYALKFYVIDTTGEKKQIFKKAVLPVNNTAMFSHSKKQKPLETESTYRAESSNYSK